MGMFDFMKFWKKKDPMADLPPDLSMPETPPPGAPPMDMNMPGADTMPPGEIPGASAPPSFEPTSSMAPEQPAAFKQMESPPDMQTMPGAPPATPVAPAQTDNKDMQLINAKLDAIKAGIDSLHQRMDKMELQKEKQEAVAWR